MNQVVKLSQYALKTTDEDVKKSFDQNYLDILDRMYADIPMRYKIDFLHKCQLHGADPRKNQVYLMTYNTKNRATGQWEKTGTTVFSYHFLIHMANQTGESLGVPVSTELEEVFDPISGEVKKMLVSTATAHRRGREPITFKARWWEFNNPKNPAWSQRPYQMLEKTAIANALRWAFPEALSGVFIREEMEGDDREIIEISENDIESTAKTIEKEKNLIEDVKDDVKKDDLVTAIAEAVNDLTKGLTMEDKASWMLANIKCTNRNELKVKTKKELKEILKKISPASVRNDEKENQNVTPKESNVSKSVPGSS